MARSAISTVQFRSMDLEAGDICQLKLHGVNRWVKITSAKHEEENGQTYLAYKAVIGSYSTSIGEYELVRTQVEKEPA